MPGGVHLQVLWSANGPSLSAGPVTVVSEFGERTVKLNSLLQVKLQTWGSGSNSRYQCFVAPYGVAGDHS